MISRGCSFFTQNHLKKDVGLHKNKFTVPNQIKIGNNCWICANVIVVGGVTIGNNCCIAVGSVVTKDIPNNCLAGGNPCVILKRYI